MTVSWTRLVEAAAGMERDPALADRDDPGLVDEVVGQARRVAVETARWIALVAELTVRGIWADQGAKTPGAWLSWKVGMGASTAREHVRVGLALRSLPKVRARFESGTLSYSKVRAITRIADPESQELLLAYADSCPANQLEKIVARTRRACRGMGVEADPFAANAADPDDPAARVEDLRVRRGRDGSWELVVRVDEVDGARLEQQLRWLAHRHEDGPPAVRQVLALLDAVASAVDSGPRDTSGEDRDRLVVQAVVAGPVRASAEAERRASAGAATGGLVPRVSAGRAPAMSVRSLRRLACGASAVVVVTDEDGNPLDVGRSQRTATAAQRRALLLRDGGCRFPGCGATTHLHAHHAVEWDDGGPTDLDNLVLLCGFHHRFVHNADWQVVPHGRGRFTFLDTAGQVVARRASAEADLELPVVRRRDTIPPDPEVLQPRWWDGEPIDWDLVVEVLARQLLPDQHEPVETAVAA